MASLRRPRGYHRPSIPPQIRTVLPNRTTLMPSSWVRTHRRPADQLSSETSQELSLLMTQKTTCRIQICALKRYQELTSLAIVTVRTIVVTMAPPVTQPRILGKVGSSLLQRMVSVQLARSWVRLADAPRSVGQRSGVRLPTWHRVVREMHLKTKTWATNRRVNQLWRMLRQRRKLSRRQPLAPRSVTSLRWQRLDREKAHRTIW